MFLVFLLRRNSLRTRHQCEFVLVGANEDSLYPWLRLGKLTFARLHGDLEATVVLREGLEAATRRTSIFHETVVVDAMEGR